MHAAGYLVIGYQNISKAKQSKNALSAVVKRGRLRKCVSALYNKRKVVNRSEISHHIEHALRLPERSLAPITLSAFLVSVPPQLLEVVLQTEG
jgi:hypothetical protein